MPTMQTAMQTTHAAPVVPEEVWLARQAAHERRVDDWVAPAVDRARHGETHPVEDFLFTYYSHRPAQLRRWSPGAGVVLIGATDYGPDYASVGRGLAVDVQSI